MKLPNAYPKSKQLGGVAEKVRPRKGLKRSRLKSRGPRTKKSGGHLFPKRRNPAYREWIRMWACLLRGRDPKNRCPLGLYGAECAHVKSRGAGGGDFGNCIPLCTYHHQQQHRLGIKSFEQRHGFNVPLAEIAADFGRLFLEGGRGVPSRRDAERCVKWKAERGRSLAPTHPQEHP